jgi:hypothetical protein
MTFLIQINDPSKSNVNKPSSAVDSEAKKRKRIEDSTKRINLGAKLQPIFTPTKAQIRQNAIRPQAQAEANTKSSTATATATSKRRGSVDITHDIVKDRLATYNKKQAFVIHPQKSAFYKKWDVVVGLALVFTAIVTPPEVST